MQNIKNDLWFKIIGSRYRLMINNSPSLIYLHISSIHLYLNVATIIWGEIWIFQCLLTRPSVYNSYLLSSFSWLSIVLLKYLISSSTVTTWFYDLGLSRLESNTQLFACEANSLTHCATAAVPINERLLYVRLTSRCSNVSNVIADASTDNEEEETKENFYRSLQFSITFQGMM